MTEKVPSLSPGRGTLTNKWVPKPKPTVAVLSWALGSKPQKMDISRKLDKRFGV